MDIIKGTKIAQIEKQLKAIKGQLAIMEGDRAEMLVFLKDLIDECKEEIDNEYNDYHRYYETKMEAFKEIIEFIENQNKK